MKIIMQIGISAILLISLMCTFASATENTTTNTTNTTENATTTTENTTTTTEENTYLVESYHPYANNYENTWTITESGAGEIRVHFTKIELKKQDSLQILDKNDKVLKTYSNHYNPITLADVWSEWHTGDTLKIKLVTNNEDTAYGFAIDKKETRGTAPPTPEPTTAISESYHDYANNYENTWTITEPEAGEIRVHFTKIELKKQDSLQILDKNDKVLKTYSNHYNPITLADVWSEWHIGDTLKIKLVTNNEDTAYGFAIDKKETRGTAPSLESDPPVAEAQNSSSTSNQKKSHEEQQPICGNNICESNENCENCPSDCSCSNNKECKKGLCVLKCIDASGCDVCLDYKIEHSCDCDEECNSGYCKNAICSIRPIPASGESPSVVIKRIDNGIINQKDAEIVFGVRNEDVKHKMEGHLTCDVPSDVRVTSSIGVAQGMQAQYTSSTFVIDIAPAQKSMSLQFESEVGGSKIIKCTIKYALFKEEYVTGQPTPRYLTMSGDYSLAKSNEIFRVLKFDKTITFTAEEQSKENTPTGMVLTNPVVGSGLLIIVLLMIFSIAKLFKNRIANKKRAPEEKKKPSEEEKNATEEETNSEELWECEYCGKEFETEKKALNHEKRCKNTKEPKKSEKVIK